MKGMVTRQGVVKALTTNQVTVVFDQRSACASCHAAGSCTSLDSSEKSIIVARGNSPQGLVVGESVTILMPTRDGQIALLIGHVFPIVLLLCVVAVGGQWVSDLQIALISIVVLAGYYLGLIKLSPHLSFSIKINKTDS
ncbi:MAG: SoxR reducing system RseC family protein [Bdellovibrionales bacterium]|jgi:positive regulator of sigma E activity|nr:SoxR reducing system RseC family protein [Bdellovibrionales bacterium]MBT3526437.1 SoxR reducing system RseC family protein [Bdellovibrionales bacterium]MBT7669560.1 SoxR reducing system RseC family protein [Bdellovibrionales bacterium]MBT7765707.1 SoxR reducing system RseC family protein [Bdellovibrionales bacterium]